jgi:single-strand DNA-binding protein
MNLNKAIILGRVTADPQLRTTAGGQSVTTFGIATNRAWTDKQGSKQEDVEFHNIVLWGRQAEIASQFLAKGGLVLVEGRIATRTWEDKEGQTRRATEIIGEHIQLGPKPEAKSPVAKNERSGKAPKREPKVAPDQEEIPSINLDEEEIPVEDIPF